MTTWLCAPGTFRTFTEVVTAYLDPVACPDADCSPSLINFPAPGPQDSVLLAEKVRAMAVLNGQLGWSRTYADYARLLESARTCLICAEPAAAPLPASPPPLGCEERLLAEGALAGTGEADITGGANDLSYDYLAGPNLLERVRGTVASDRPTAAWQPFAYLREDHTYAYDRSGNLVRQTEAGAGTTTIDWNAYGKVTTVTQAGVAPEVPYRTRFGYGPDQQRWTKHRYIAGDGGSEETVATTYYVRDAQGSVLTTYERQQTLNTASGALSEAGPFVLKTHYLYRSTRLGEVVRELPLQAGITPPDAFGRRHYEITNHLGNVATVIGEHVVDYTDITGRTYQVPEVLEQRDYLPFGLGLARQADEHHAARGGVGLQLDAYRFGFQNEENEEDLQWIRF